MSHSNEVQSTRCLRPQGQSDRPAGSRLDHRLRQGMGWITLGYCTLCLILSLMQWPTLNGVVAGYLNAPIGAAEVWLATLGLLLLNLLWLGAGAFLAIAMIRGLSLTPWVYFLCCATLLFGDLFSKALAATLMLLRLREASRVIRRRVPGIE